ncbi:hypothetical protein JB92DRAFT_2825284 [Gautieria morchelliformis]|nr:hypothetical protein JB92DRAFT_2825284 [Gautieria morchelliformis]
MLSQAGQQGQMVMGSQDTESGHKVEKDIELEQQSSEDIRSSGDVKSGYGFKWGHKVDGDVRSRPESSRDRSNVKSEHGIRTWSQVGTVAPLPLDEPEAELVLILAVVSEVEVAWVLNAVWVVVPPVAAQVAVMLDAPFRASGGSCGRDLEENSRKGHEGCMRKFSEKEKTATTITEG